MMNKMKQGFGKLASLKEAKEAIFGLVEEKDIEAINIDDSLNRALAENIIARIDVPDFKKSAMDGFAVRAEDTFNASNTSPKKLKIIDSVTAGVVSKKEIKNNECIAVTTGAPLPMGADSVLMVEFTEQKNNELTTYKSVAPGENTINIGSDIKKGLVIAKKGFVINPRIIGAIASQGIKEIKAKKKPLIAYFSTGNEIIAANEKLEKGKVYDINSKTIISALKENNCNALDLGIIRDDKKLIKETIKRGLEADFVLLSGGSSLGSEDFMVEAVNELGSVLIHGIAVKPGKPVLVGKVKDKLVLGLPGYPTSALSNFYILVVPIIHKMLGIKPEIKTVEAKLSRKIVSTVGRYEFLAVKLENNEAVPVMKGSSSITTLAEADGFIEIDENTEVLEKGSIVTVRLF